ncbi:hypothetical protein BGZ95_001383, partial [Linnemannia exigua]
SAIPCGPVSTPSSTTTTTTAPAIEATAETTENPAAWVVVDFKRSSIATATKAIEASMTVVPESSSGIQEKVVGMDAGTDTSVERFVANPVDHPEVKTKDKEEEVDNSTEKNEEEDEELKTAAEQKDRQMENETEEKEEENEEEEKETEQEKGGPLSAAEAFAKSLTAVTTTLDPAATQLMDQLRLQEHLRASTSLPTATSTTIVPPGSNK